MIDKNKFMEMLSEIAEIGKASNCELSQEKIKEYFKNLELEESHFEHIYAYLSENKINVIGFDFQPPITEVEEKTEMNEEDSDYLKMYLEDIKRFPIFDEEEENLLFSQLLSGSLDAKNKLMESQLNVVVDMAYQYKNKGINMEDLIQEGNISLIKVLEDLCGTNEMKAAKETMISSIQKEMETIIDDQMNENDWENTVLAKTNLINEAVRYLAKDLGRVANIHELSEYTKIPEGEIMDILNLSANVIHVGECAHHH